MGWRGGNIKGNIRVIIILGWEVTCVRCWDFTYRREGRMGVVRLVERGLITAVQSTKTTAGSRKERA
jgi:hypothetical protein